MMTEMLLAVLVASVLGSAHCVGMCGPFAVLASGNSDRKNPVGFRWARLIAYHLGRWTTYLALGAAFGLLGSVTDGLAASAGWSPMVARVVGAVMIVLGVVQALRWIRGNPVVPRHSMFWQRWSRILIAVRQRWKTQSAIASAYSWGFLSTWLPCGWLYLFVIAAAGTGSITAGMMLMTAFWIGTLPLLSALTLGASLMGSKAQRWIQPLTAVVLIAFGAYTATGRAAIDLRRIDLRHSPVSKASPFNANDGEAAGTRAKELESFLDQDLPCCEPSE